MSKHPIIDAIVDDVLTNKGLHRSYLSRALFLTTLADITAMDLPLTETVFYNGLTFHYSATSTLPHDGVNAVVSNDSRHYDVTVSKNYDATTTITVGSGGDHATVQMALIEASKKRKEYSSTIFSVGISLLTGFVMAEQILLDGQDLG